MYIELLEQSVLMHSAALEVGGTYPKLSTLLVYSFDNTESAKQQRAHQCDTLAVGRYRNSNRQGCQIFENLLVERVVSRAIPSLNEWEILETSMGLNHQCTVISDRKLHMPCQLYLKIHATR